MSEQIKIKELHYPKRASVKRYDRMGPDMAGTHWRVLDSWMDNNLKSPFTIQVAQESTELTQQMHDDGYVDLSKLAYFR